MNQTLNNNKKKFACDRCEFSCDYKSRFDSTYKSKSMIRLETLFVI
jgi:hypothetical protein